MKHTKRLKKVTETKKLIVTWGEGVAVSIMVSLKSSSHHPPKFGYGQLWVSSFSFTTTYFNLPLNFLSTNSPLAYLFPLFIYVNIYIIL